MSPSWLKDKEGNIISYYATIKDITERKQVEEKFRAILKTAIDGFLINDLEGRLLEVNDSYCKMVGYTREELLKMSISDIEAIEKAEDIIQHIQKLKKQGYVYFET